MSGPWPRAKAGIYSRIRARTGTMDGTKLRIKSGTRSIAKTKAIIQC